MKIAAIELSGFRGFRDTCRLELPRGFAVISGRNGVGKSTICDAVEYALTGFIEKYEGSDSTAEPFADYVWWRRPGAAPLQQVSVFFADDELGEFVVTRRRDVGLVGVTHEDIAAHLCHGEDVPENALEDLVRTSILRDELIATLRLDLSETKRFSFVSSALGAVDLGAIKSKSTAACDVARRLEDEARREYELQRDRVGRTLAELSGARDAAYRADDASRAREVLARYVEPSDETKSLLAVGRAELARRLSELSQLRALVQEAFILAAERQQSSRDNRARVRLDKRKHAEHRLGDELAALEKQYESTRDAERLAAALEMLADADWKVVTHDGRCPLCDCAVGAETFGRGLAAVRQRSAAKAEATTKVLAELDALRSRYEDAWTRRKLAQRDFELAEQRTANAKRRDQELQARAAALGVTSSASLMAALEQESERRSKEAIELERALGVLDASRTVDRVKELEILASREREELESCELRLAKCTRAVRALGDASEAITRTGDEALDERLASMSPILNEFYQRLRPHAAFQNVTYRVAGELRRLLRLAVEGDLDPEFLFSSGQRRAAGLAFLLSLHVARRWSRWRTLILDDPIQHIDDFRALNLIEVLSALRRDDHQIIIAVEDEAVADALCRRLRSTARSPGVRIELGLNDDGIPYVARREAVEPLVLHALDGDAAAHAS